MQLFTSLSVHSSFPDLHILGINKLNFTERLVFQELLIVAKVAETG